MNTIETNIQIPIRDLRPHPLNQQIYTLSSIDELVNSISEVGLLQNITVDQYSRVISGHRRLESVKILGWKSVTCDRVVVDQSQEISLIIHFNKQRVKSCREILNEVKFLYPKYEIGQGKRTDLTSVRPNKSGSTRDIISEQIGISSSQIGKLLFVQKHNDEFIDLIDRGILTVNQAYLQVSRVEKEKKSLTSNTRHESRSNTEMFSFFQKSSDVMKEIRDEETDLIFTSPPYWNKREYVNGGGLGNEKNPSEFVTNLTEHLRDCYRILSPTGSFFLVMGDTYKNGNLQSIPHRVILQLQEQGWILRNTIIWSKTNPKPQSSKTNLTPSYEFIFHLVKSLDYKYDPTLIPVKHSTKPSLPPRHRTTSSGKTEERKIHPYIPSLGKNMGDWWSEEIVRSAVSNSSSQKSSVEHPAPFPEQIVILPVLQTTSVGDLVVDPFMGTGTTGRVANDLGRRFIGYDIKVY